MTQLDLGRATLRIRGSKLQLHITATAHFNQLQTNSKIERQESLSQPSDFEGIWVTEAPEMELRFFFNSDWTLKDTVNTFVSELENKLCGLKVWSDLGFSAGLNVEHGGGIDTSGTQCLKLVLRREHKTQSHKRGWNLPIVMANPPDVCPPPDVLSATLVSINVSLEYCLQDENMIQTQDFVDYGFGISQRNLPDLLTFESSAEATLQPEISSSMPGYIWLDTMHHETLSQSLESHIFHTSGSRPDPSCDDFFQLFELGMRMLVISNPIKDPKTRIFKDATLKCLPDIAPAAFNAGHRETINQRGVTIPIITKAISIMLNGSQSRSIEDKLPNLLLSPPSYVSYPATSPQVASLRAAIHFRLWRIAQENTRKSKPLQRKSLKFPTTPSDRNMVPPQDTACPWFLDQQNLNSLSGTCPNYQIRQSEESEVNFASIFSHSSCQTESEGQLLDDCSETSFTDIGESTQTSLDTLFSAALSSQTAEIDDENMLLSNYRGLAKYGDGLVTGSYSRGKMETHDADILMLDGF